jgi:hypothetical protein
MRRRIVPLSVLKESVNRKVKIAILDRVEARFVNQELTIERQQEMINAHNAFLDDLSTRKAVDFRQEFTTFYLRRATDNA